MKKEYLRYGMVFILVICLSGLLISCGPGPDGDGDEEAVAGEGEVVAGEEAGEEPVESVADHFASLTVDPATITVEATATVTADVRDSSNNPVPDGTTVTFSVENPVFGTITASSTTNAGEATATFTADAPGDATINASSGDSAASVSITIEQAPAAAIQFRSATPNVIALAGTGGDEISEIQFVVLDSNSDPLEGINVTFAMAGPGGGESIDPDNGSSNASGIAIVRLYSGVVAGPVTVSATIDLPMTVQTTGVSIGGGVPSDFRFSVAATKLNLPGIHWNGKETEVSAWLADRFGSYNILQGTTVSFGAEVGLATDTANVTLDDTGVASVTVRTQAGAGWVNAEDVLPELWEEQLQTYVASTYGYTGTTAHPRDGLCSVLVYTKGEEHFDDLNANGVFDGDPPDQFLPSYDTPEDPFYDYDDDGQYNDGATYPVAGPPYNPAELFIDSIPLNGVWDGGDGAWSADTHIFRNFKILVTGRPGFAASDWSFDVADDGEQYIKFLVCDQNFNIPVAGSTVNINTNVGKLQGLLQYTYPDSNQVGWNMASHLSLIEYVVRIYDKNPGDADPPASGEITVVVVWKPDGEGEETTTYTITGTVD